MLTGRHPKPISPAKSGYAMNRRRRRPFRMDESLGVRTSCRPGSREPVAIAGYLPGGASQATTITPVSSKEGTVTKARHVWSLVLAGGEGSRLRALTTRPCGTSVPKQYCSLHGGHSLLE